jgi:hypothetical protein
MTMVSAGCTAAVGVTMFGVGRRLLLPLLCVLPCDNGPTVTGSATFVAVVTVTAVAIAVVVIVGLAGDAVATSLLTFDNNRRIRVGVIAIFDAVRTINGDG